MTHRSSKAVELVIEGEFIAGANPASSEQATALSSADAPLLDAALWAAAVVDESHPIANSSRVDDFVSTNLEHVRVLLALVVLRSDRSQP